MHLPRGKISFSPKHCLNSSRSRCFSRIVGSMKRVLSRDCYRKRPNFEVHPKGDEHRLDVELRRLKVMAIIRGVCAYESKREMRPGQDAGPVLPHTGLRKSERKTETCQWTTGSMNVVGFRQPHW
jgi:hypothetical protein